MIRQSVKRVKVVIVVAALALLSASANASGEWRTSISEDVMTGEKACYAISPRVESMHRMAFPYSDTQGWIGVGSDGNDEWAYFGFSNSPNLARTSTRDGYDTIRTRVRWDDQVEDITLTQQWGSQFLHVSRLEDEHVIKKLAESNSALLELNWYGSGNVYFEFPLNGSANAIAEMRSECWVEPPAPLFTDEVTVEPILPSRHEVSISLVPRQAHVPIEDYAWVLPIRIAAEVTNSGETELSDLVARWESPLGLELTPVDRATKAIGPLDPGETTIVDWFVRPEAPYPLIGNLVYSVKVTASESDEEIRAYGFVDVPPLSSHLVIEADSEDIAVGDYFTARVKVINVRTFYGTDVEIHYDPQSLELVGGPLGIQRGDLFVDYGESRPNYLGWQRPVHTVEDDQTAIIQLSGNRDGTDVLSWATGTIATLQFRALRPGEHAISIVPSRTRGFDRDHQDVRISEFVDAVVEVKPSEN